MADDTTPTTEPERRRFAAMGVQIEDEKIMRMLLLVPHGEAIDADRWAQTYGRTADEILGLREKIEAERGEIGGEHE